MSKAVKEAMRQSDDIDLTPMIDVVFNLLIFFMVVSDLSQKDIAELTLPLASASVQDKADDPDDRMILNVDNAGRVMFRGEARSLSELGTIIEQAKRAYNLKQKAKGLSGEEEIVKGAPKASKLFVLLRADRNTPWQHVQWLMTVMAEQKLYKLQFAAKQFIDGNYKPEEAKQLDGITQKQLQELQGG